MVSPERTGYTIHCGDGCRNLHRVSADPTTAFLGYGFIAAASFTRGVVISSR